MTAEKRYEYYYEDDGHEGSGSEENAAEEAAEKDDDPSEEEREIRYSRTETRAGSFFRIFMISVLAAAMLGSVIYSLDRRSRTYNKVSKLNRELSLEEAENVRLQSELDGKVSAKNVEDYAENVLGMKKIDSSQIKYIKIQTDDVVNIPEQDETFFTKVEGFFNKIVEYFRG